MKTVTVASTNPVKIEVAKRAFATVFPLETFEFIALKSESGVPAQPMNDETKKKTAHQECSESSFLSRQWL